jgi:hypothetical protein
MMIKVAVLSSQLGVEQLVTGYACRRVKSFKKLTNVVIVKIKQSFLHVMILLLIYTFTKPFTHRGSVLPY